MKPLNWLLFLLLALGSVLLFAPTPAEPVAWTPPKPPASDSGPYARNQALAGIERSPASLNIRGPEALTPDAQGHFLTGLADGRVIRLAADLQTFELLGNTGGRPLGMAIHPDGRIIIADGVKGLLGLDPATGNIRALATEADGKPIRFADDVSITADGRHAYFSDATLKWKFDESTEAVMEHAGDGRLLRHDFDTGKTTTVLGGLEFANGVALGPDDAFVLVNETGAYRVRRLWLKGEKAGQNDVFADNLPGLPDNTTFNGRDRFWVALFAPRNPLLELLAPYPGVRKALLRVIDYIPRPVEHRAMALGFGTDGRLVANLQDDGKNNFSPITSIRERDGMLYFGSLTQTAVGRMAWKPAP